MPTALSSKSTFSEPLAHELQSSKEVDLIAHADYGAGVKIMTRYFLLTWTSNVSNSHLRWLLAWVLYFFLVFKYILHQAIQVFEPCGILN